MYTYSIKIYYNKKEDKYVAVVPELPGFTVSAKTREQIYEKAKTALEVWLKQAIKEGKEIPQKNGKKVA